jgi:hypothetical protein
MLWRPNVLFETVFKLRIVYKNGYTHDFECTDFEISSNQVKWGSASQRNRPIKIGVDDIAAVWQVGTRKRLKFFNK